MGVGKGSAIDKRIVMLYEGKREYFSEDKIE